MKEIKFRGLRTDGKKFIYGNLMEYDGKFYVTPPKYSAKPFGYFEIIPETVGQFTNIMHRDIEKYKNKEFDKYGNCFEKEVFEGDIVEFKADPSFYINAKLGDRYVIEYFGAGYFMKPISWKMKKINAQNYIGLLPPYQTSNMRNHYEVIGNIHENPELIK